MTAPRPAHLHDASTRPTTSEDRLPGDDFWPRLARAGSMLLAAAAAHVWLVHEPRPNDGSAFGALVPAAISSIAVSRAVAEPPVTLIHEDVVVSEVRSGRPFIILVPSPRGVPAAVVRQAMIETARDEVPVGTVGLMAAGITTMRPVELASGLRASAQPVFESVVASLNSEPADANVTLPEIPYVGPRSPAVFSSRVRLDIGAARSTRPSSGGAPPAAIEAAGDLRNQEQVVLQVVRDYTRAYERMDVRAAKALWPSLDDRKLRRAFEQLDAQQLRFPNCGVSISGQDANARCKGDATYHPKVGSRVLHLTERVWTFNLSRSDAGWQIVDAEILDPKVR
jgi:hypothetical protein